MPDVLDDSIFTPHTNSDNSQIKISTIMWSSSTDSFIVIDTAGYIYDINPINNYNYNNYNDRNTPENVIIDDIYNNRAKLTLISPKIRLHSFGEYLAQSKNNKDKPISICQHIMDYQKICKDKLLELFNSFSKKKLCNTDTKIVEETKDESDEFIF